MYRPPAPLPRSPVGALVHHVLDRERDLLTLLPRDAYRRRVGRLGRSRRTILLVNDPAAVREVMIDRADAFPKNDLFDGALSPLVRDSVFNSHGDRWRHQRALIEPAFAHMHVRRAFEAMSAACDDAETRLDAAAAAGRPVALDAAMSRVTADVVFRALFSESLESDAARDIFEAFAEYQATVAQISPARLILGRPFATPPAPEACRAACERIRARLRDWIAERLEAPAREDIVGALIAARHPQTGARFDLEELVDQIGVFFLAGHETTAGALTWALFMLSQDPAPAERLRAETHDAAGDGTVTLDHVKRLNRARAAFREAMRLYPPLPFLPRIALEATRIAGARVPRGA
ncbi:MAG: cytochrome P450 [Pseudomonadota bacterium]